MVEHISAGEPGTASSTPELEQDVELFGRQIETWLFRHVRALGDETYEEREHAGFAILMLTASYFEAIESYHRGHPGKSSDLFIHGLLRVLPELGTRISVLGDVYDELRCGLYHHGAPKGRVTITRSDIPVQIQVESTHSLGAIIIDPWALFSRVEEHFAAYLAELRNTANTDLREAFRQFRAFRRARVPFFTDIPDTARSSWP
jgi:hypothetical protein